MSRGSRHATRPSGPRARRHQRRRYGSLKQWLAWTAVIGVVGALGVLFVQSATQSSEVSAELEAIAIENARGPIEVYTGSQHTVYHATEPLPTQASPRGDGKPVLVWFSGTWCSFCKQMEPFAHQNANEYTGQFAFMEKSVDHDRDAAARFGVRGTPTFVFMTKTGEQVDRFSSIRDAESFRAKLDSLASQFTSRQASDNAARKETQ